MADGRREEAADKTAADNALADERQRSFTRRALIRAGWMVPVVTTVNIPAASAQTPSPHNDVHGDAQHLDQVSDHLDVHADTPPPVHTDHSDHSDVPHIDATQTQVQHTGKHTHSDVPPTDPPHHPASPHTANT